MARPTRRLMLLLLLGSMPAMAETLACRSVNGNVTCAGDGAVSCQTVNGRTNCVSGGGAITQEFGGVTGRAALSKANEGSDERTEARPAVRAHPLSVKRLGPGGVRSLEREDGRRQRHREAPPLGTD
jgi:hypothetical protein